LGWSRRLGPLIPVLGIVGLAQLLRRASTLGLLASAWAGSGVLSVGALIWTLQALRWQAFIFPVFALSGGVALAALDRQGRAGRALAYAMLAVVIVRGAVLWYTQILTYQH
jgi:hypothetical protein